MAKNLAQLASCAAVGGEPRHRLRMDLPQETPADPAAARSSPDGCVFCAYAGSKELLYEDDEIMAFRDKFPKARTHYLVVPKRHLNTVDRLPPNELELVKRMHAVARQLVEDLPGRKIFGYHSHRTISVDHLHLHAMIPPFTRWFWWPAFQSWIWMFISDTQAESMLERKQRKLAAKQAKAAAAESKSDGD